jgi:hypothetical protein
LLIELEGGRIGAETGGTDAAWRMEAYPRLLFWQINAQVSGQDELLKLRAE